LLALLKRISIPTPLSNPNPRIMKLHHVLAIILVAAAPATTFAIPQTITGNNGIFGSTGGSFERYATDAGTWAPGAVLAGKWSAPGADGTRTLTESTVVFGLTAAEVRAEQSSDRVTRLHVVFRNGGKKPRVKGSSPSVTSLMQNIGAFTGATPRTEGGSTKVFLYEQTQIRVSSLPQGEVVVDFTPVR
jgi:hypothetical protein